MSAISVAGDTSGSVTLQAPAVAGSTVLTLPAVSGTVLTTASTDTANSLNAGIGVNQTWQDLTASRAFNTTYYNTTGKTISVSGRSYANATVHEYGYVNGITVSHIHTGILGITATNILMFRTTQLIVPTGSSYRIESSGLQSWAELR